jgi:hypothetical protein
MKKKAYKVSLEPSEVSDSIFIELEANSEFREHDKQLGYIDDNKVTLYSSSIDREILIDVALAIIESNEETEKEPVVEEAPF